VNPYAGPATDYYILFRDTEVPVLTGSDYGKRCVEDDLLIADKAAYVWGYVGELNDGQVRMIQERLDGFYEEGFKEEFRFSHTDIPSSHGFEITIVVRGQVALKVLAEVSPDLEFISRNSPLHRFRFFPKTDEESMRIKQALSSLPDEKKPSIRWSMYEVEFPQKHRSFVRLLPSKTLMDGLERVGYDDRMNRARHTAAIWIIDTALSTSVPMRNLSPVKKKHSQLDTKAPQHPLTTDRPKFDGAAFQKLVYNETKYIPALTERQLEVFEQGVMIANNIRTAFNCGYRNIENKYESVRLNNEAMRLNNEAEKIHNETERIHNEKMRIRDEEMRLQDEAERVRNEAMRMNAGKFSKYPHLMQAASGQGLAPNIPIGEFTERAEVPMGAPGGTPHIILAARKRTKKKESETTDDNGRKDFKDWLNEPHVPTPEDVIVKNPKDLTSPIVKTLQQTHELLEKQNSLIENNTAPQPVYYVDNPKDATLKPEDCPVEGKDGFWETQEQYAERVKLTVGTLTAYRKTSEGAKWSSDGTWGTSKKGRFVFKKIEPNNPSSEFMYFVRTK
jgi:hypothetical protein